MSLCPFLLLERTPNTSKQSNISNAKKPARKGPLEMLNGKIPVKIQKKCSSKFRMLLNSEPVTISPDTWTVWLVSRLVFVVCRLFGVFAVIFSQHRQAGVNAAVEEKTVDVVGIAASRSGGFKGKSVATRPEESDLNEEWVSAAREAFGQKKKRVRTKKTKQVLNHIADIFSQFKLVQVEIPLLRDSCEAALEALAKRKEYYQTAPPPEAKKATPTETQVSPTKVTYIYNSQQLKNTTTALANKTTTQTKKNTWHIQTIPRT